jgi:Mg2+ and Co2+ transporter CorA
VKFHNRDKNSAKDVVVVLLCLALAGFGIGYGTWHFYFNKEKPITRQTLELEEKKVKKANLLKKTEKSEEEIKQALDKLQGQIRVVINQINATANDGRKLALRSTKQKELRMLRELEEQLKQTLSLLAAAKAKAAASLNNTGEAEMDKAEKVAKEIEDSFNNSF